MRIQGFVHGTGLICLNTCIHIRMMPNLDADQRMGSQVLLDAGMLRECTCLEAPGMLGWMPNETRWSRSARGKQNRSVACVAQPVMEGGRNEAERCRGRVVDGVVIGAKVRTAGGERRAN